MGRIGVLMVLLATDFALVVAAANTRIHSVPLAIVLLLVTALTTALAGRE